MTSGLLLRAEPVAPATTFTAFFGWDDAALAVRRAAEDDSRVENRIQSCMREHGLDYTPRPPVVQTESWQSMSPVEYAATYGFGIAHEPSQAAPDETDPVAALILTLQEPERTRWVEALVGSPSYGVYGSGCAGRANQDVRGARNEILAPVRAIMRDLDRLITNDPRMIAADRAWSTCVGLAGFPVFSRAQLGQAVEARIVGPLQRAGSRTAPEFERIAAEERQFAVAVAVCDAPYLAGDLTVREEVEGSYISGHRDELAETLSRAYPSG